MHLLKKSLFVLISPKCVPKGSIDNTKSLPELVMTRQICVTTDFHLQSRRDSDCQMSELCKNV